MFNPENSVLLETCNTLHSTLDSMDAQIASINTTSNISAATLEALVQARNDIAEELGKLEECMPHWRLMVDSQFTEEVYYSFNKAANAFFEAQKNAFRQSGFVMLVDASTDKAIMFADFTKPVTNKEEEG